MRGWLESDTKLLLGALAFAALLVVLIVVGLLIGVPEIPPVVPGRPA